MKTKLILLILLLNTFLIVIYGASGHNINLKDTETQRYFGVVLFNFISIIFVVLDRIILKIILLGITLLLQVEILYMLIMLHDIKNITITTLSLLSISTYMIYVIYKYQKELYRPSR